MDARHGPSNERGRGPTCAHRGKPSQTRIEKTARAEFASIQQVTGLNKGGKGGKGEGLEQIVMGFAKSVTKPDFAIKIEEDVVVSAGVMGGRLVINIRVVRPTDKRTLVSSLGNMYARVYTNLHMINHTKSP